MMTRSTDAALQAFLDVLTGVTPPDEAKCRNCEGLGCPLCWPEDSFDDDAENWRLGTIEDGMRRWTKRMTRR